MKLFGQTIIITIVVALTLFIGSIIALLVAGNILWSFITFEVFLTIVMLMFLLVAVLVLIRLGYKNKLAWLLAVILCLLVITFFDNRLWIRQYRRVFKERLCPTAWIDNQMPSIGLRSSQSQYFVVDRYRVEFYELDVNWIMKNCTVRPQVVW